jgi:L-histidine N-alpha-methyltransferase
MRIPQLTVEVHLQPADRRAMLLADARQGLTASPKSLSPVWFYDERGSNLFDQITRLPEYYLTRAERRLLAAHAAETAATASADTLIELGSGISDKTRVLLDAMGAEGSLRRYVPLDVDETTLRGTAERLVEERGDLDVNAVVGDFATHLDRSLPGERRLVAFLGSTIGNLTPRERHRFLSDLDCSLRGSDRLLLGVDLVKDPARLVAAYDDARGVTAAFNRNALRVLGRETGAALDEALFDHVAVWDDENSWIEMRLCAKVDHVCMLPALDMAVAFERGEHVRTEISAKFTPDGIGRELNDAGFVVERQWADDAGYLLILARPYC